MKRKTGRERNNKIRRDQRRMKRRNGRLKGKKNGELIKAARKSRAANDKKETEEIGDKATSRITKKEEEEEEHGRIRKGSR